MDAAQPRSARFALAAALAVAWLNFLLTVKWAHLPGALNGWKRPWYFAALAAATLLTLWGRRFGQPVRLRGLRLLLVGGWILLGFTFLYTFPLSTWNLIPFQDDWVPRFQSTADGVALLEHGAVAGWQWAFLGGYQTSADLAQSLTALGFVPMALFGDRIGYHLVHLLLVTLIPLLVYLDLRADGRRDVAELGGFFALVCSVGLFGTIMPSGDTNAIAGVLSTLVALAGSRLWRLGYRVGGALLVAGLALTLYTHTAFFLYAWMYLMVEALFYRDWRAAVRANIACAAAVLIALPQYFELIAYRPFFRTTNNVYAPGPVDPLHVAREVYYNVEILFHPHRWFNDYLSLTNVFLIVIAWVAWRGDRTRPQVHAWAALATIGLLRLNVTEAGYLLVREMHMLAALVAAPLAWFILSASGSRKLAWSLVAVVGLYVQTQFTPIPHVRDLRDFDAALVDRISGLDGHLVLLENSPHADLDSDPRQRSERTPFVAHFDALVPAATGRLLYGQPWDCWHWTPFRGQVVAAGAFRGQAIAKTPIDDFAAEMRKWGVRHLVVWSGATRRYLDGAPDHFTRRWSSGRWAGYEMRDADPRGVVTASGSGSLAALTPLDGQVRLTGARAGTPVVVRTDYFPAWTAWHDGRPVPLFPRDGQLAFTAPADGDYTVRLVYPRRPWALLVALLGFIGGAAVLSVWAPAPRVTAAPTPAPAST